MSVPVILNGTPANENHSFEGSKEFKGGVGGKKKSLILNAFVEMCKLSSC